MNSFFKQIFSFILPVTVLIIVPYLIEDNRTIRPDAITMLAFADMLEPKRVLWVEGHDHFFAGALDEFERTIQSLD